MKILQTVAAPKKDEIRVSGGRIMKGKTEVGVLMASKEPNINLKEVLSYFQEDKKKVEQLLVKLTLPKTFDYIWIEELSVLSKFRGKGLASTAVQSLKSKSHSALIALNAGSVQGSRMDHKTRCKIYEKMGFTFIKLSDGDYGFKVIE